MSLISLKNAITNLKSNKITEVGAQSLAQTTSLSKLEQLILKFTRIGEEGAKYLAKSDKEVWFCGCKRTKHQPFCDGSHSKP